MSKLRVTGPATLIVGSPLITALGNFALAAGNPALRQESVHGIEWIIARATTAPRWIAIPQIDEIFGQAGWAVYMQNVMLANARTLTFFGESMLTATALGTIAVMYNRIVNGPPVYWGKTKILGNDNN